MDVGCLLFRRHLKSAGQGYADLVVTLGRPPKCARAWNRRRLLAAVRALASQRAAAQFARVHHRTLERWLAKGRRDREAREDGAEPSAYERLLDDVEQAGAEGELTALAQIEREGMRGEWQALAWILERCRSSDYSRHLLRCSSGTGDYEAAERERLELARAISEEIANASVTKPS